MRDFVTRGNDPRKDLNTDYGQSEGKKSVVAMKKSKSTAPVKNNNQPVQTKPEEEEEKGIQMKEDPIASFFAFKDAEQNSNPSNTNNNIVQAKQEEEEPLQAKKSEEDEIQMKKKDEDEEILQRKGLVEEEPIQAKKNDEEEIQMKASTSSSQMPKGVQSKMENSFGTDFSDVNIHANSDNATNIGALAYTQGKDIHFAPGQYNPESQSGQELLGHELTHVVQQSNGNVQPTTQMKGVGINDDKGLEKEADEMGKKAAQNEKGYVGTSANLPSSNSSNNSIQRATSTPSDFKSYAALTAMTISELDDYATVQADWHASPSLNDNMRHWIRSILSFARENERLGSVRDMKVGSVKDKMLIYGEAAVVANLSAYSDAVKQDPFDIPSTSSVDIAYKKGESLIKLKKAFPSFVLKSAFDNDSLDLLISNVLVDEIIKYYSTATPSPIFMAEAGADVYAYNNLWADGANPLSYFASPLIGNIRNYHRFQKEALDRLKKNFSDTSKTKPLTLILHSGIDHNGAFHRDPNLTAVIKNDQMNTLMMEGKTTLDEVKNEITPLAKKYGKNDKIDQVMFAGHGNARTIQLAGTIKDNGGKVEEVEDSIDLDSNQTKTDEVFDELLKNMDDKAGASKQAHRNMVFNACLTNSNSVGLSTGKGKANQNDVKKDFKQSIIDNGSLTSYLQNRANKQNKDLSVKGSNASFGQIELIDKTSNNLDLISSEDPKLTASKLVYLEFGTEPTGALRAVVEAWANDEKSCFEAMERRVKKAATAWDDVVIKTCYEIILSKYKSDGVRINNFTYYSYFLGEGKIESLCRPEFISNLDKNPDINTIYTALSKSSLWSTANYIPLVFYQNWMTSDPSNAGLKTSFLNHLETKYTCQTSKKYIDIKYLDTHNHYKDLLSGSKSKGKLMLALLGVINSNQADCKKYVLSNLNASDEFDSALNVNNILDGASDENSILIKIGKKVDPNLLAKSSSSSAPVVAPTAKANVTPFGESKNTIYVDSLSKKGTIIKDPKADVYTLPDSTSKDLGDLAKSVKVNIIGRTGNWFAIEYKSSGKLGTAFVETTNVTTV